MAKTPKLIRTGWRISEALTLKIDRVWSQRRAKGNRETKQDFAARLLEEGLSIVRTQK